MFPIKIAICGYPLFSDTPSVDRNPHGSTVGSAGDQQIIHPPRAASVFSAASLIFLGTFNGMSKIEAICEKEFVENKDY